jgi:hypothetical protein
MDIASKVNEMGVLECRSVPLRVDNLTFNHGVEGSSPSALTKKV